MRINGKNFIYQIEYNDSEPYSDKLSEVQSLLDSCGTLVGFNLKFDLNWLRRYGLKYNRCRVFDLQLAEFILAGQRPAFPSLDGCLAKYGLGAKYDIVAREYWDRGIDTPEIPLEILIPYLEEDLRLEDELYRHLQSVTPKSLVPLINLGNQDLLVLHEMEVNGLKINWDKLKVKADETQKNLEVVRASILESYVPSEYREWFNVESGEHLSALLFGGTITRKVGTPYEHCFKTGQRAGETVTRYKWETTSYRFKQMCSPPTGSELKKEGVWSTDEETLKSLRQPRKLTDLILKYAELSKLLNTYLNGLVKIRDDYDWKDGMLHGTFNQCRVITGRLSSEKPNQQNFPPEIDEYITSRF